MNWRFGIWINYLFLFLPFCASTQEYLFDVEHFTVEDGLSHNQVRCIFEDSRSILWIGTSNGLNRFDGETFKHFTKEDHGLSRNVVGSIVEDKDGMLWLKVDVGTHNSKVSNVTIFNPFKERAEDIASYLGKEFPLNLKDISDIRQGEQHELLLATVDSTFLLYKGRSTYSKEDVINIPTLISMERPFIWEKPSNTFWIGMVKNNFTSAKAPHLDIGYLIKVNEKGDILQKINTPALFSIPKLDVRSPVNRLLYHCQRDTLYELGSFHYTHYKLDDDQFHKLRLRQNGRVLDLAKAGAIGYLDESTGLMIITDYHSSSLSDKRAYFYFTKPLGNWEFEVLSSAILPIEVGASSFRKVQNSLWFSVAGKGLYRMKLKPKKFQAFTTNIQQRNILKDEQNRIWIKAKDKYDNNNFFSPRRSVHSDPLAKDDLGCIWGINLSSKRLVQFCPPDYEPQFFYQEWIDDNLLKGYYHFFEDHKRRIQIFPSAYIISGGEIIPPDKGQTSLDTLDFFTVYHVWQDQANHFWMATGGALYELDENLNHLGTYNQNGKGRYYLPTSEVHHFHVDSEGIFWLAGAQEGLIRWDRKKEQVRQFTKKDGLASNILHAVYEDDYGFLWLNSENGIIRFNKENYNSTRYGMESGISHLEGNSISHFKDEDGTLYFGSYVGVTKFHPQDFVDEGIAYRPRDINIFTIYQKDVRTGEVINLLPNYKEKGLLKPSNRSAFLEITFVPPDIEVMLSSRFEYQLGDTYEDWVPVGKNKVTLADLPYGEFSLKVRNTDFNQNSTHILEIPIYNPAPFYLQWWFVLLMLLGVILTSVAYARIRTWNLKRQRALLRIEVERQTQALQVQAEKLKGLDKVKSRFFANVSHELRTPVTLIKGPIQTVLKNAGLSNRDFTLLKKAQLSTDRLLKIINEILDLTKLESGKLELNETPIVIYPALQRMLAVFESHAQAKNIRLELHNEAHPSLQILLDQKKLETIFYNLLSNALKFTAKNGKVTVRFKDLGHHLLLTVEDTGRGIHPDDLPYVFDRFYQTKRMEATAEGGTGIGLALSSELAKLFKGKLWAVSDLEAGSTFFFEFPKKEVFGAVQPAITQQEVRVMETGSNLAQPPANDHLTKPVILLVEDNYHLRDYMQLVFSDRYEVITAGNGEEALERLMEVDKQRMDIHAQDDRPPPTAHCPPSLILSDVMMPIMDGFQLLEKLKSDDRFRHIPVIMLTARAEMKDKLKALRIGVDDYMIKPFEQEELLIRMENLLNNSRERQLANNPQRTTGNEENSFEQSINAIDLEWLTTLEETVLEKISKFDFNVEALAREMNMGKRSLERKIKTLVGMTPAKYIQEIRLTRARRLLEEGFYHSVKEVTYAVGLKHPTNFSKCFEKRFGKLPSEFFKT